MQNIYTLIKKREVKGDGTNTEMDWSEWLRSQECFECCFGKKACVFGVVIEN